MPHSSLVALLFALATAADGGTAPSTPEHRLTIPLESFTVFKQDSGPVNYYSVVTEEGTPLIRGVYRPGLGNVVLYAEVPEAARKTANLVTWRWRVHALPKDANDCGPGFSDNAASVFLAYKVGLKLKVVKYVWSTQGAKGSSCESTRGWFFDRDTVLLEVGGPMDTWKTVEVDPRTAYVKHYGGSMEDVPDFVGVGLMTDGDNSQSPAAGDYADFVVRFK